MEREASAERRCRVQRIEGGFSSSIPLAYRGELRLEFLRGNREESACGLTASETGPPPVKNDQAGRPCPGHSRSPDLEDPCARADERLGDRPAPEAGFSRGTPGQRWL